MRLLSLMTALLVVLVVAACAPGPNRLETFAGRNEVATIYNRLRDGRTAEAWGRCEELYVDGDWGETSMSIDDVQVVSDLCDLVFDDKYDQALQRANALLEAYAESQR